MSAPFQSVSLVADFTGDAYYTGPAGIMGGGPAFTAAVLFSVAAVGDDQYIVANRDAVNFRGWALGMRGVGGGVPVPTLFVQIGNGIAFEEFALPIPDAVGKLVCAYVSVGAGAIGVSINGAPVAFSIPIPGGSLASGLAPTIGAREGGNFPDTHCPIVGLGYSAFQSLDVFAVQHAAGCRRIYDFSDFFDVAPGPSWTHWYTVRRGAVVAGRQPTYSGPLLQAFPQAAASWAPAAGNGVVPDAQARVPLTLTGGSPTNPGVFVLGNPLWAASPAPP